MSRLIMADATARLALADTDLDDGTPARSTLEPTPARQVDLIITEGVPDWLDWAYRWSDANESPPAVIGLVSGSWNDQLARQIPNGCRVVIRRHLDDAGAKYAKQIAATLAPRCRVWVREDQGAGEL